MGVTSLGAIYPNRLHVNVSGFFICDGFMQATLILDNKAVKTKVFADNHDVDDLIKKSKAMVRRYDGYPFIQIKNTSNFY